MSQHLVSGISVIIPNYNGRQLLEQILEPVQVALQEIKLPSEIIVCDDCSTDDTLTFLRNMHPSIRVIENRVNRGFAPTINGGIFAANHSHLLLLNSDVKLEPGYFSALLRYFERPDTFGVMGRIVGWDDDTLQDGGKYPSFHGVKIKTSGNYVPVDPQPGQWLPSMYLSGANAFVDRAKTWQLQGFDELYAPFYVEDYDLSLRAWRLGWKCYYDDGSVCRHKISVSIRSNNRKRVINAIYNRNKMYLHAIHLTPVKRFLWFLQLIPEGFISVATQRWSWFKSLYLFVGSYGKVIGSRKRFRRLAGDAQLLSVDEVVNQVCDSLHEVVITRF